MDNQLLTQFIGECASASFQRRIEFLLRSSRAIVIVGAGEEGVRFFEYLHGRGFTAQSFIDHRKELVGKALKGLPVTSFENLSTFDFSSTVFCVAYGVGSWQVVHQLRNMGITNYIDTYLIQGTPFAESFDAGRIVDRLEKYVEAYNVWADSESKFSFLSLLRYRLTGDTTALRISPDQPYYHPSVRPRQGDVIIDGGAFDGDSALSFVRYLRGETKVYSFEPAQQNYRQMVEKFMQFRLEKICRPVPKGLWSCETELKFDKAVGIEAKIDPRGEISIPVIDIDTFVNREKLHIDLIKLDIEGSELEALAGAQQTILQDKPRLQVCVYHHPDHVWQVPLLIKQMNPKYKLYFAHHTHNIWESLIYAVHA